ncbi:MAG TPA: undecaprenyl-diphosphatase UppP [bacterium]|nr:undecaprenyl-diphosphatase UppP [bacterium]
MSWLEALLLGILQGLTEFLPVSSSGHLVLVENFLLRNNPPGITFEIALHIGTLFAVFCIFREDIKKILISFIHLFKTGKHKKREDPYLRLLGLLLLGTIPISLIGGLFRGVIERLFEYPRMVSLMLIITGIILWATKRPKVERRKLNRLNIRDALGIGLAQVIGLIPGISRSGVTISCGLFRGLSRDSAYRFSFLLAIPAIIGAAGLEFRNLSTIPKENIYPLIIGTIAAFLSGLLALKALLSIIKKGRFSFFAYYLWVIGLLSLGVSYIG